MSVLRLITPTSCTMKFQQSMQDFHGVLTLTASALVVSSRRKANKDCAVLLVQS
jgi:hypothetical protein